MKTILTYGTFDLLHTGHLNLLEKLSKMGDRLFVGVSTDEFNELKGKNSLFDYDSRARLVNALSCVDLVFPENEWTQKEKDIERFDVDVLGMGDDWKGQFDNLKSHCKIVYLPRTQNISSTILRQSLSRISSDRLQEIKKGLDDVMSLVNTIK